MYILLGLIQKEFKHHFNFRPKNGFGCHNLKDILWEINTKGYNFSQT